MTNRELDMWVAEHVMGAKWRVSDLRPGNRYLSFDPQSENQLAQGDELIIPSTDGFKCPRYSTDLRAAWQIAERLSLGIFSAVTGGWIAGGTDGWTRRENGAIQAYRFMPRKWARATTPSLAICHAALLIVGQPGPKERV